MVCRLLVEFKIHLYQVQLFGNAKLDLTLTQSIPFSLRILLYLLKDSPNKSWISRVDTVLTQTIIILSTGKPKLFDNMHTAIAECHSAIIVQFELEWIILRTSLNSSYLYMFYFRHRSFEELCFALFVELTEAGLAACAVETFSVGEVCMIAGVAIEYDVS